MINRRIVLIAAAGILAAPTLALQLNESAGAAKPRPAALYVYKKAQPLPPGKERFLHADCPRRYVAVGGGFTQFDENRPETDGSDPAIVLVHSTVVSSRKPPNFDARRFEVALRNNGTSTSTVASVRAVCLSGLSPRIGR